MRHDPWSRLQQSPSNLRGLRIAEAHPLSVYWVRRSDGACGVVFQGIDEVPAANVLPCLRDVDVAAASGPPPELALFLTDDTHREVFQLLCEDVIEVSSRCASVGLATAAVLERVENWAGMLAAGRPGELGEQAVRGLMGELFLLDALRQRIGLADALGAWVAPDDHPQDFSLPAGILEAKTRLATARQLVSISSLEQLETGELPLALWVIELTPNGTGASLNSMVDELLIRASAEGSRVENRLRIALFRRGYEHSGSYDVPRYRCSAVRAFRVLAGFPRITRSGTDLRIRTATYQLDLAALGPFEIDPAEILATFIG